MKQTIALITLAVENIDRALAFYRDGLKWKPAFTADAIAFFQMNGVVFSLFEKDGLAKDFGGKIDMSARSIALAHNVASRDEVDAVLAEIDALDGGRVVHKPVERDWGGYSGYFEDPDGHVWEVAWNPHWRISPEGLVSINQD